MKVTGFELTRESHESVAMKITFVRVQVSMSSSKNSISAGS